MLKADNVPSSKLVPGILALKKFWIACRDRYELDRLPDRDSSVLADANIPASDDTDIAAKWKTKHNFALRYAQLLIPTHQGRLWRDAMMIPPRPTVWLAETLRTRSCINKSVGHQLSIVPGRPAETVEVIADCIEKAFQLWTRIRAFFMTLAYATIGKPDWFPLQAALLATEHILNFITSTYEGRTPPVQFLVSA